MGNRICLIVCSTLLLSRPTESQVGVTFHCPPSKCHVGSVIGEGGGFVGKVAGTSSKVAYSVRCGNRRVAAEVEKDARGGVSALFSEANGFACDVGGTLEIRGLADGGWYWIVDRDRAAAAPLIAKDALGNAAVTPWDPDALEIDLDPLPNGYATAVWHAASTSLSLISHILPEPRVSVPRCGPKKEGDAWVQISKGCRLGDGGTAIAMVHGGVFVPPGTGRVRVNRPSSGELRVRLSLWGNGTGHVSIAMPVAPRHGHYVPGAEPLAASSWSARVQGVPGATGGVTLSERLLTIHSSGDYCNPRATPPVNVPVTLTVSAKIADPASVSVMPPVDVDADSVAATRRIVVGCPGAIAARGKDLLAPRSASGPERR